MRKSEADLLLDHLQSHYDGSLRLQVVNLKSLGFQLPPEEPPYFVVGSEGATDNESGDKVLQREREVVVSEQQSSGWTVKHLREWEISRAGNRGNELYIYDTRNREFVPPEKFHIPEEPI